MESEPPVVADNRPAATDVIKNRQLFASLYGDLRRLAERQLRGNEAASVSPTTLLHEAYIGMENREAHFPDRERFMGYAARVMRGLIIDLVRERRALKRGGAYHITQLPTEVEASGEKSTDLARLSDALDELAVREPRLAGVVDLQVLLWFHLRGHRLAAGNLAAHRHARLGEGSPDSLQGIERELAPLRRRGDLDWGEIPIEKTG